MALEQLPDLAELWPIPWEYDWNRSVGRGEAGDWRLLVYGYSWRSGGTCIAAARKEDASDVEPRIRWQGEDLASGLAEVRKQIEETTP